MLNPIEFVRIYSCTVEMTSPPVRAWSFTKGGRWETWSISVEYELIIQDTLTPFDCPPYFLLAETMSTRITFSSKFMPLVSTLLTSRL